MPGARSSVLAPVAMPGALVVSLLLKIEQNRAQLLITMVDRTHNLEPAPW